MTLAEDVDAAAARLRGVAMTTPLQRNERLSAATGANVWLKREDLQVGRSYKLRGAYNLLAQLEPGRAGRGRGLRQRRQPRPGRRVRLPAAGHPGPGARAEHHAAAEARAHPGPRRRRGRAGGGRRHLRRGGRGRGRVRRAAPAPPSCPRSTTCAPSPGRAPSASRSSPSSGGRPRWSCCRSAAAGCWPGWAAGWPSDTREVRIVGVEPAGAAEHGRGPRPPGPRWCCPSWTPSWTAPRCAGSAT